MKKNILFVCALALLVSSARAEGENSLEEQVKQLTQKVGDLSSLVQKQHEEIQSLQSEKMSSVSTPQTSVPVSSQGGPQGSKWNPEMGAVADTLLLTGSGEKNPETFDRASLRELEVVLGSNVDPYSRLDVTLSFSDSEDPGVEEGYLTYFGIPGLTARLGKFKPKVGKQAGVHRDSLDTADEPLVIQQYFSEEGLSKSGVDFVKILDLPWDSVHEVSLGVLEGGSGEEGVTFGSARNRPVYYGHLKNYFDLTDVTSFELGLSGLLGSSDEDSKNEVSLLGVDLTAIHHFTATQNVKFQSEFFGLHRDETLVERDLSEAPEVEPVEEKTEGSLWGAYALLDFRLDPRWALGLRYDQVQPIGNLLDNPEDHDQGVTAYLTFYQSEFARWRAQVSHFDLADGENNNQFLIQGTFAIGAHKHKLQ